jgi:predicted amidohydrolase YtcJ
MTTHSRRRFLGASTAAATAVAFGWPRSGAAQSPPGARSGPGPDLIVWNARVYTMDPSLPRAEAIAVKNGRFVAVGSNDDVKNLKTSDTETIDGGGMTVVPGFIDAHSHPSDAGISELLDVNCDLRSVTAIKDAIAKRAAKTPPGEWIKGFKYDDTKLREGRPLNRRDLDEAAPKNPVIVTHRGGHTSVYSSQALSKAGISASTPDPVGGKFYRENGELTGLAAEHANDVFQTLIPQTSTRAQRQAGVKLISELMTAAGLTTVHETGIGTDNFIAYQDAYRAGEMRFRMYAFPLGPSDFFKGLKMAGLRTGYGDDWLQIGAVKYVADGSASERTMRMSTPFEGKPDDFGILTMTAEEVDAAVKDAYEHDFQIGIHSNGDVTIRMVLDAYEKYQKLSRRADARPRIEHCSLVDPEILRRIKAVGAIPTPFYTYVHYHGEKWENYGTDKMERMFAHKSFLDYGIPVAAASDYTPGPFEPMMALQSMVTRKDFEGRVWGASQRITIDQALTVCTRNAAYASFEENKKGSIEGGKLADFVILGQDPHDADPDHLKEIEIVRTVVGGKTMHRRDG